MTDIPPSASGGFGLSQAAADASGAVAGVGDSARARASADAIDQAFTRAGESLAQSLAKAASDGKVSLGELASAAISVVDTIAKGSTGGGGIADALASALSTAFGGARADGGAVAAGGAYLVGERGPEVFRPSSSGDVAALGGGGTTVNVTVQGGGAAGLLRSEAQIASALARAVAVGVR